MDVTFVERVMQWAQALDQLNYYQLLRVEATASQGEIRKAYHAQSRLFHPDRYFHLEDGNLKQAIYLISKRVTEAYVTLRDPKKRQFYDQQLGKAVQPGLRYTETSEQEQKKAKVEEIGKTEKGRQFYRQGMGELKKQNFAGAERMFKTALAYEPDNELFKRMREEAGSKIKTDYMIK
jgi:curved DNA-binding protein CbpA